jgi:nitrate reductase gamma subunit
MLDTLLLAALPYVALSLFLVISIQRYRRDPFTFSSLSSQFLESRRLYWGSVPFHVGIITLFFGHLIGFLFPRQVMAWNGVPARLFVLETTALAAAILCLVGLVGLILRRASSLRLRVNTSVADIVVYVVLMFQIVSGLWVALSLRWGSAWYTQTAVPYVWSIFRFDPQTHLVAQLPWAAKLHVIGAWILIGAFSFTRLVHALVAPVPYLWRPLQLVIWNRDRRRKEAA